MWKDYSWSYIKNNRASSISVMIAAFISALFLSLLCSIFYNFWMYDIEGIKLKEGSWQGRIVGKITKEDLAVIRHFANVEKAVINKELSSEQKIVVDLYFNNIGTILEDMPLIADLLGLKSEAIVYHHTLLSMYFISDPQDPSPRLIFPFFLAVIAMSSFSLIMIIHNIFAVSMNARIHQIGIFSSIGATPGQIRICLLQEAAALCILPILLGNLFGIVISMGVIKLTNNIAVDVPGRFEAVWEYHPLIYAFTIMSTILTVWISAWLPARKLSRLTPLQAIRNTSELQLKRKKNSCVLALIFGIEGELAGNALKAQRKALRTTTVSLTFSFLAFTIMQCFFTLSYLSTRMTYFERYQDAWDVMVTVKDTGIEAFRETAKLQELSGVHSCTVYQKAMGKRMITKEEISEELAAIGGLPNASKYVSVLEDTWLVNAPIVILDDTSFLEYCEQIGVVPRLDGAVILNRIRSSEKANFRSKNYFSYLKGNQNTTVLRQAGQEKIKAEISVLAYTQKVPVLREEYGTLDYSVLVHFLPVSMWEKIKEQIGGTEENSYIRVLAREGVTLNELNRLEEAITQLVSQKYETESENRIKEKMLNDKMIHGIMLILGSFCILLAIIGIANLFSITLGFVRQRKQEFARYMSVGLTPNGIQKMFCIEALVIAGRPVLITLPVTMIMVGFMIKASYLDPMVFIKEAPIIPILTFILAIFGFVALAYYLGGKKVMQYNLADALRDDTMT